MDSEIVVDSAYYRLRKDRVEIPGGEILDDYYVREGPSFAVIFALTANERIILVRQYKYGADRVILELPAGMLDDGEAAAAAAARELEEETGYSARSLQPVRDYSVGATNSSAIMHLFFAQDATVRAAQRLDRGEAIEVVLVSANELYDLVARGEIDQIAHVCAVYEMLNRIGYLKHAASGDDQDLSGRRNLR